MFLLKCNFRSLTRRLNVWYKTGAHFTDFRPIWFNFGFDTKADNPRGFNRAFFSSDVIRRSGDRVLDIGCGDGFFTKHFYSYGCSIVHGIDIEPSAIKHAQRYNSAENIEYFELDAIQQPFPSRVPYDVVIWDGAIGHFSPDGAKAVLRKVALSLKRDGVFTGSESLGNIEGSDHLQFFMNLGALADKLKECFKYVEMREISYPAESFVRREAYWRCAELEERLREHNWRTMTKTV